MATKKSLQLLRSNQVYSNLAAAKTAISGANVTDQDGVAVLGRYYYGEGQDVKTVLGIKHIVSGQAGMTYFENTDEIQAQIDALQTELDNTQATIDTNADGTKKPSSSHFTSAATTIEAEIAALAAALEAMDASSVSGESKVVIDVTQEDGQVTATAANLTGVKLDGLTAGTASKIAATDTLGEALANIQAQIDGMDKTASSANGQVVVTVTEVDGVVDETKANVKDLQLGGYVKDTTATGDIASDDTINAALSKLENKADAITIANADGSINVTTGATGGTDINVNIKSGEKVLAKDGGDGLYTDIDLVKITTGLPAEIKERYQLLATDDSQIGVNIDVPKDSHIVSINYITTGEHAQNLEYVYIDVSGNTQTTYVDMSELVLEAEFASGVTVTDHIVHGVVDPTSESFLTVGDNGFKLAGVQDAINTAISGLDATVGSEVVATGKHVAVEVVETDGKLTSLTVTEDDIASASALTAEIAARKAVDGQTGQTYEANSAANYISTATSLNDADILLDAQLKAEQDEIDAIETAVGLGTDGTHIQSQGTYTSGASTVEGEIDALDNALEELSGKVSSYDVEIASSNDSIDVNETTGSTGSTFDITTDTGKIKLSGFTPSTATTDTPPADGDTINEAMAKLYAVAQHHHLSTGNKGIAVDTTTGGTTVTLTLDTASNLGEYNGDSITDDGANALEITDVTNGGLFLSKDWDCGTF